MLCFLIDVWHFRYALDVHTDRAEDVLTHMRLLEEAKVPEKRPVFHVRAVQVSKKGIRVVIVFENPFLRTENFDGGVSRCFQLNLRMIP